MPSKLARDEGKQGHQEGRVVPEQRRSSSSVEEAASREPAEGGGHPGEPSLLIETLLLAGQPRLYFLSSLT